MSLPLGGTEAANVANFFNQSADKYGNDSGVEVQWAMQAYHHADTYFKLITAVDPKRLKLTRVDDEICSQFLDEFADVPLDVIDEENMKSKEGKQKWRAFCDCYQTKVEDYNMGTLLRVDCRGDVSDKNTMIVPRIQFLAIEIARNRQGLNSGLREKFSKTKSKAPESTGSGDAKDSQKCTDSNNEEHKAEDTQQT